MADRLRLLTAALPAVVAVGVAWALLEQPVSWPAFVAVGGCAVAPALVRDARGRLAAAFLAGTIALSLTFAEWPHAAVGTAWQALHDAPAVRAPFDPAAYPGLHDLVLLEAFALALLAALSVASRVPSLVAIAVALGVGFPAALLQDAHALRLGALALGAVLWAPLVLRAGGSRRALTGVLVAGTLVAVSGGVAVAGLTPGKAHVDWRGWDPFAGNDRTVNVAYVWDANYDGIEFPTRPTTVLRVRAPKRAEYWRVSTLETFADDRWIENLYPVAISGPRRTLPADPLVPQRDALPERWLEHTVTIEGLDETRIPAASQPARIEGSFGRVLYLGGGVMRAARTLRRGTEYTIWSYSPSPTPRVLARSRPRYPQAIGRYLELGRARLPAFGSADREARVDRLFGDDRYQALWAYRPLWEEARRRTARARSPYEATLLLERFLRRDGGFRYEEQPPRGSGPPLVDFVEVTRAGYCQQYAGAMAVMLRFIGIPARVAVGFTAGTWKGGVWTVTDQQAHAWVEAWFAGHGWLAFDPTPGRGLLSAVYTLASDSADAVAALGTGRFLDFNPGLDGSAGPAGRATPTAPDHPSRPWWLLVVACIPAVAVVLVLLAKAAARARRLRRRSARALAAGVRAELVAQLVDRGASVAQNVTLGELADIAQRVLRSPVGALTSALADARFGPPERSERAAARARHELGRVLAAARARERPGGRLRRLLSLRSLRPGSGIGARLGSDSRRVFVGKMET